MEIHGKKVSNWWLVGGAGGLVVVYYVYKRGSSSSSSTSQTGTDPVTGLPYSEDDTIDPLTGLTYLAEAQQYGSVSAAEQQYSSTDATAGYPATGGSSGYYNALSPTSAADVSYSSNSAWSQAVTQGLVALGYNSQDVATALGLYLDGKTLGTAADGASYLSIVQAAVAEYGAPPVGTFGINAAPTTSTTPVTTTTTPVTTTTTPVTTTTTTASASTQVNQYPAPGGLTVTAKTASSVSIQWNQTNPAATSFTVAVYQDNGKTASETTVAVPDATGGHGVTTINGLHSSWNYNIHVWANGGKVAPPHATVSVTLPS